MAAVDLVDRMAGLWQCGTVSNITAECAKTGDHVQGRGERKSLGLELLCHSIHVHSDNRGWPVGGFGSVGFV